MIQLPADKSQAVVRPHYMSEDRLHLVAMLTSSWRKALNLDLSAGRKVTSENTRPAPGVPYRGVFAGAFSSASGANVSEAEFIQYRNPVGWGPSSNRWPKCASHLAHRTSVRTMPNE